MNLKFIPFVLALLISSAARAFTPATYFPASGSNTFDVSAAIDTFWIEFDSAIPTSGTDLTKVTVIRDGDAGNLALTNQIVIDANNSNRLIIPANIYTYGVQYTVTILQAAFPNDLAADVAWSFTSAKRIVSPSNPSPANNATDVHPYAPLKFDLTPNLTLSESFDNSEITIEDGIGNQIGGISTSFTVGLGLSTVTIQHDPLQYGKTYTVTIGADALVSSEKTFGQSFSSSFSTPAVAPPAITDWDVFPTEGSANVSKDSEIYLLLPIAVSLTDIDASGITITAAGSTTNYLSSVTVDPENSQRLILQHSTLNAWTAVHTVTIPAYAIPGLTQNIVWTFTLEKGEFSITNLAPTGDSENVGVFASFRLNGVKIKSTDFSTIDLTKFSLVDNYGDSIEIQTISIVPGSFLSNYTTVELQNDEFLKSGRQYTVTVAPGALETTTLEIKTPVVWSFTTAPLATLTPAIEATEVALDTEISAKFASAVTSSTSFAEVKFGTYVDGAFTWEEQITVSVDADDDTKLVITPTAGDIEGNTRYTVLIPSTAVVGLTEDILWSFTTDKKPISINTATFLPQDQATGVSFAASSKIRFGFAQGTNLTDYEIDWTLVSVLDDQNNDIATGVTKVGNYYYIEHTAFSPETHYTVTIPQATVEKLDKTYTWEFTTAQVQAVTVISSSPADGDIDVAVDADITVTFGIDPSTNEEVNLALVSFKDASDNSVTGISISKDGETGYTYKIAHDSLAYNTTYTVTIPLEAIYGFTAGYSFSFTTEQDPNNGTDVKTITGKGIEVYPRVTSGEIKVTSAMPATVRVTNLVGHTSLIREIESETTLNLGAYANGIYMITVNTVEGKAVYKIIKK